MFKITKKSSTIIVIIIISLIIISSEGVYSTYLTYSIEPDAEIINNLGIIRGSIQKLAKLELAGQQQDDLIVQIEMKIFTIEKNEDTLASIKELKNSWDSLKESIITYRQQSSEKNKKLLLQRSEEIWEIANNTVFLQQLYTERKVGGLKVSFIFFLINVILGLAVLYLIKIYVRDHLEYHVNYDALTGIYNRRYFSEQIEKKLSHSDKRHRFSLIVFDIDFFKKVNDTYGHSTGDYVLKEIAIIVHATIRNKDIFARIGGEEFAIILQETSIQEAYNLAERIRYLIAQYSFDKVGQVTISLGITNSYPNDNFDLVYSRADSAMYQAKTDGRNRCSLNSEIKQKQSYL